MTYGSNLGPIGLNSYNSLFGRSAYDVQNPLDPAAMITNMTSSFLGMSGQVGWGTSQGLLSNPYLGNPYLNMGNSLWSMPSPYPMGQFNSPYGMLPYGYGQSPYGFNPYLMLVQPQPQLPLQQPELSWQTLFSGLMTYFQNQPQATPGALPVLPQVITDAVDPTTRRIDDRVVNLDLGQAPVRSMPSMAPSQAVAPSFSQVATSPPVFTTPSGVTPPARWARTTSPSNNVFANAYPPAATSVSEAPMPAPAFAAPMPAPAPAPSVNPAPSFSGFLGGIGNGLGNVAKTVFQNLPMINVGKAADKKPGQVIKNVIKNLSSHDNDDDNRSGGISRGAFGLGKAWKNKGH